MPSVAVRNRWVVLLLLVLVMCISFFDRGNLAVAAPVITRQFHLSPWSLGILLSAFFWTYSVCQIGTGWLVDHMEARLVFAAAFLIWSLATLSTALVSSFAGFLIARLVLGVGESAAYPATSHILAGTFPEQRRGLANSLIDLGARFGPAAGTFCGALLIQKIGWRGLFVLTGIGGLLWLIPWLFLAPRSLNTETRWKGPPIGWRSLLSRRAVWGTIGGLCGANYAWYFLLGWLPTYLVHGRGLSLSSMAIWGSLPYMTMAITSLTGGILADHLIARGHAPVPVRKGFLTGGLVASGIALPAVMFSSIDWALAGLEIACLAFGFYASNLFALTQTLAGPEAAGRWTGLQNASGNLSGIVSAMLTGWLVTRTGHFAPAFIAASIACFLGAASFFFLVRSPGHVRTPFVQPLRASK